MGIIVTGEGPRSGTSAMMRLLLEQGWSPYEKAEKFPSYTATEMNPEGYWDLSKEFVDNPTTINLETEQCAKVWFPHFPCVVAPSVDLIIIMYRKDWETQLGSIERCCEAEGIEFTLEAAERSKRMTKFLAQACFPKCPILLVETEELRRHPNSIISQIKEINKCQ